ncbi:MAG: LacI family DNA-binding transcriptional regulator [Pseudomonadota bacterium]
MADGGTKTGAGRVTIRTVAEDAGVSVAAVSKVMRNAYGVSEALRLKVEASIARLGYRPSVAARGMRGQTFTLGVLLVGIDNPILPLIYGGIEGVAEAAGYKIMVGVGAARMQTEARLIEQMLDNRMDGLILVASRIAGDVLERYARQIPIVVVGHHEPSARHFDTVNNDDRQGARIAVGALIDAGHRDIAMLALPHPEDHQANVSPQRERGYREAMAAAGLSSFARIVHMPQPEVPRHAEMTALLSGPDRPRAVFCWSDLDAIPLINVAHELGLRVPADVAVVGYDNSQVAAMPVVGLTSVDQDARGLGEAAARALLSRIGGRSEVSHVILHPRLVCRTSHR